MPRVILVCGYTTSVPYQKDVDYIGVDHGAYICAKQGIQMKVAIGDFDSVTQDEFSLIQRYSLQLTCLPTHKDETDTEKAVLYALELGYTDLEVYGCLGGRMDHEMANLYLLMHRQYPITFLNEKNRIRCFRQGEYKILKEYTYFSFLALEDCCVSGKGFAYPFDHRHFTTKDILTISNEIIDQEALLIVHQGSILVMEAND